MRLGIPAMTRNSSKNGFSLVELIISSVVISVIGAAAWSSSSALMQANEVNRNNVIGVNLLRKSQEEVRQVAQSNFDTIGTGSCHFGVGNTCGFEDITATFPGYTRTMTVGPYSGSTELKQVNVTVSWTALGQPRTLTSIILLSRPSQAVPGNVMGLITNGMTGAPIGGVDILVTRSSPAKTLPTISSIITTPMPDGQNRNYTFLNMANQFQMEAGTWSLTARLPGYVDYVHPTAILVTPNTEQRINIQMTPSPNATITVYLSPQGTPPGFNAPFGRVGLYKGGALISEVNSAGANTFSIPFTSMSQQCFTVATRDMYRSGYAGGFSCSPPQTQDPRGWSSSVVQADNSLVCSRPWNGSSATGIDRVCVSPGEARIISVPVVPVATRTVTGYVRRQDGTPIANTPVVIRWHDGGDYPWPQKSPTVTTNSSGFYSAIVPALQELFANSVGNYLRVTSSALVPVLRCCNVATNEQVSATIRSGPLFRGNALPSQDITISTVNRTDVCGDASGSIRDARTGSPLSGVAVNLSRAGTTDSSGAYMYRCAAGVTPPYSIVAGTYTLTATRTGYYAYNSGGNSVYSRLNATGGVPVAGNQVNAVGSIGLWPQGSGTLNITVLRQGTATPVTNASVALSGPTSVNLSSGSSGGVYAFNNILETWPVPEVLGNPQFNQTVRTYTVRVTHSAYEDAVPLSVTLNRGETKSVSITMIPKGGM